MKDTKNNFDAVNSIDPDDYAANKDGTAVDLRGFDGSTVVFSVGKVTDGAHTPKIQESHDKSKWADVSADDQEGALVNLASNINQRAGYKGGKRYLRAVLRVANANTGAQVAALIIRGIPHHAPVD